jgi:major intrinsic protein
MDMPRRLGAEFFGTFWLTFAGCGSAVLAAGFPSLGIGFLGVSFAFGLTVLTMAYAVGHISGGHFNCAVTVGLWAGGRFKGADVIPYILAQTMGWVSSCETGRIPRRRSSSLQRRQHSRAGMAWRRGASRSRRAHARGDVLCTEPGRPHPRPARHAGPAHEGEGQR